MAFSVLCLSYSEGMGHPGGMPLESESCCLMASQAWAASRFARFMYAPAFGAGEGSRRQCRVGLRPWLWSCSSVLHGVHPFPSCAVFLDVVFS